MVEKTLDPKARDAWFRAKVQEALDDPSPPIPHAEVEAQFAKKRAISLSMLTLALLAGNAAGQATTIMELKITPSSVTLDGVKTLPDDAALKTALTALAQQKPRPRIRLTGSPDVPFDKVKHVIEIMGASGFDAGLGLVTQTAR